MLKSSALLSVATLTLVGCQGSDGPMGPAGSGIPSYTAVFQYQLSPATNYTGVRTTFVDGANPTVSYGNDASLFVAGGPASADWVRSLLWFDVSSLPANAEVQGAYLSLRFYSRNILTADTFSVGLHEVNCAWEETVTWNQRYAGAPWGTGTCGTGGAAAFTRGRDFAAAPMDTVSFHALSATQRFLAWNLTPSVVQRWLDDPAGNWGVTLASQGEGSEGDYSLGFYSRVSADLGPALVVTYTIP